MVYLSQRNISTDFPVLTCAVSCIDQHYTCIIGARPLHAVAFNGIAILKQVLLKKVFKVLQNVFYQN